MLLKRKTFVSAAYEPPLLPRIHDTVVLVSPNASAMDLKDDLLILCIW
jgi:hypothetical protein